MAATGANPNRLLLSVIGLLISIVGVLGKREIATVEGNSAKTEERLESLYQTLPGKFGPITDKQIQFAARIDALEKFRDYYSGLEEGRGKRIGEVEGSLRVLISEKEALGQRVAHLEGKEDRREIIGREIPGRR